jgi:hypothetical protein
MGIAMKIINPIAAVCTIVGVTFAFWWAYVTAVYGDKHKIIAFILCAAVVGMSAFICTVLYRISRLSSSQKEDHPVSGQLPLTAAKHIYIGPSGIPVSLADGKISVDLRFFSCANVRLLHLKVDVGSFPHMVTLSDSDPEEIKAGEMFTKTLEEPAPRLRELVILKSQMLQVKGTAKFSDDIVQQFSFEAPPLLG